MYRQAAFTARPGYLKSRADSRFLSGISHFGLSPNINSSVICCLRVNSTHQLQAEFLLCSLTTNMLFPYLSSTPPENQGIHSDVRQLTGSMGISPLRGSHRAARRRKSHYPVTPQCCAGSCPAFITGLPLAPSAGDYCICRERCSSSQGRV